MRTPQISNITVLGAGLMGHGIALEFAVHGFNVNVVDRDEAALEVARHRMERGLALLAEAGTVRRDDFEGLDAVWERLHYGTDAAAAGVNADLVIEAVYEDLALKQKLLTEAATTAPSHAIFASNTSSFMPSQLASSTGRANRFAITHYFNPPYLLPLVEIVTASGALPEVAQTLRTLYEQIGKRPVVIEKELPGFVANRLQGALTREATALVEAGVAAPEDVDTVVKYGFGRRLAVAGPFEIWEQIGWDLVSTIATELFAEIARDSAPSKLFDEKIRKGELGVKTSRGFYDWTSESAEALRLRIGRALINLAAMEKGSETPFGNKPSPSSNKPPAPGEEKERKKKIAVIGAGLMGHGIALEFAASGHEVCINDRNEALLENALERSEKGLQLLARTGRVDASGISDARARISASADLRTAVQGADLVIEAVTEDLPLKKKIFADLDRFAPPHAILLSNTSTYLPSALAAATSRPGKVAVAHYFNPPHLLPIVEVVRGPETSQETIDTVMALFTGIGKKPALVQKEVQGFIGNRLQFAMFREALSLVARGVATAPQIDEVVRSSFGRRLSVAGPFELRELIGLDLSLAIGKQIVPTLDNTQTVPPVLAEKVQKGELGTKTGKGFYDWTPESTEALRLRIGNALAEMAQWRDV